MFEFECHRSFTSSWHTTETVKEAVTKTCHAEMYWAPRVSERRSNGLLGIL